MSGSGLTWTDIRWWKLTDGQGHGLLIAADSSLVSIYARNKQLNIDHPFVNGGTDNYHYVYKVTPQ